MTDDLVTGILSAIPCQDDILIKEYRNKKIYYDCIDQLRALTEAVGQAQKLVALTVKSKSDEKNLWFNISVTARPFLLSQVAPERTVFNVSCNDKGVLSVRGLLFNKVEGGVGVDLGTEMDSDEYVLEPGYFMVLEDHSNFQRVAAKIIEKSLRELSMTYWWDKVGEPAKAQLVSKLSTVDVMLSYRALCALSQKVHQETSGGVVNFTTEVKPEDLTEEERSSPVTHLSIGDWIISTFRGDKNNSMESVLLSNCIVLNVPSSK